MNKQVLVVDDECTIRRILQRIFEQAGYDVTTAPNGKKALSIIQEEDDEFDIMITDIGMPKMTGRELCQHLAAKGPYFPRHTFVVTSRAEVEERSWIRNHPGVQLVEKPVGPRHLLRRVQDSVAAAVRP